MNKKINNNQEVFSQSVHQMNRNYLVGNFYQARREAKQIIKNGDDLDKSAASSILHKTWPDYQALLAGLLCLVFSVAAAFIAS